jgi:hypothetical protein
MSITTQASIEYLQIAFKLPVKLNKPAKQLIVLDLNGALVSRNRGNKTMYSRPYCNAFFEYIMKHFTVVVWSSAQPHSVDFMCRIFRQHRSKLAMIWDRSKIGLSKQDYFRKVETTKDLSKIWKQLGNHFDATNTILIDDTPSKSIIQKYNAIHPKEFDHTSSDFKINGDADLLYVKSYLEELRYQSNVAAYIRERPFNPTRDYKDNSFETFFYTRHDKDGNGTFVDFKQEGSDDELSSSLSKIKM